MVDRDHNTLVPDLTDVCANQRIQIEKLESELLSIKTALSDDYVSKLDHLQMLDEFEKLKQTLNTSDQLVQTYQLQHNRILSQFKLLTSVNDDNVGDNYQSNLDDKVGQLISELLENRDAFAQLELKTRELEDQLHGTVSQSKFDTLDREKNKLEHQLDQLVEDFDRSQAQIHEILKWFKLTKSDQTDSMFLVNLIKQEMENIEQFWSNKLEVEQKQIRSLMTSYFPNLVLPLTLVEIFQHLIYEFDHARLLIDKFEHERSEVTNLVGNVIDLDSDLPTSQLVSLIIGYLNDKENQLIQTSHELKESNSERDSLKEELILACKKLNLMEDDMSEMVRTHVPSSSYESLVLQHDLLKHEMCELQKLMDEMKIDDSAVRQFILDRLPKLGQIDLSSLLDYVQLLCSSFDCSKKDEEVRSLELAKSHNDLVDELNTCRAHIEELQRILSRRDETLFAAKEATKACERLNTELQLELDSLRKEHAQCWMNKPDLELVNVATDMSLVDQIKNESKNRTPLKEQNHIKADGLSDLDVYRARKYKSLRAVAFEIKEKLIDRTRYVIVVFWKCLL